MVDEEDVHQIKPLPNLDYKVVVGNSLLGVEKNLFNAELFRRLEELKPKYFDETSSDKKHGYRREIDQIIHQLTNGNEAFDFEIYFSEIFRLGKRGFDVVIGNPPYGAELEASEKRLLDAQFPGLGSANKNSAIYFIFRTATILRAAGTNAFIVPKSVCYSLGWSKCAGSLLPTLRTLIDTGTAFESVRLEQVAYVRGGCQAAPFFVNGTFDGDAVHEFAEIPKATFERHRVLLAGQAPPEVGLILRLLEKFPKRVSDYVSIERGLNWQSLATTFPGETPIHRGAQLSKYHLGPASDFIQLKRFDERAYAYQLAPKILNQLAVAHVKNPHPHFLLQATLDANSSLVFETISCTFARADWLDLKFFLAINNSKLFAWILYKFVFSNAIRSTRYDEQYAGRVPLPDLAGCDQRPLAALAGAALEAKRADPDADTSALEREIDQLVYQLYGLTPEEIAIVEGSAPPPAIGKKRARGRGQ